MTGAWQAWQIAAQLTEYAMAKGSMGNMIATVKSEQDWQTESDLRTLQECEQIEKDPKRLARAQALAKKKLLELATIASEGPADAS